MRTLSPAAIEVMQRLRQGIVAGSYPPGHRLRQEYLASQLGVSRLPVRDALAALKAEGLIEIRPNRAAYVATLSADECREIFDLRVLLECEALSRAIPRHDPRSIRNLELIQTELELADDRTRWVEDDRRFHETLYASSQRPRTLELIGKLRNTVERFLLAKLDHNIRREEWREEHREIIEAVSSQSVHRARTTLAAHLRATEQIVLAAINPAADSSTSS